MLVFASFGVQLFAGKLAKCNDPHIISRVRTAFPLQNALPFLPARESKWGNQNFHMTDGDLGHFHFQMQGKTGKGIKGMSE